ncbi:PIG-L family deacetylase [Sphingobacterium alkalisoli]|uniref:PIG-L family deacetylase n=1 Tax=Sphingobacterium alkalisoli TaxID=1874115 RepID=A0A4U0H889_9SPHI|nr:PIG-L family deacetylase [Sphingobacterium alkalisoli]TJY67968.1 PIG-L family deacetylase [Sphingobacterium alkalisoli]
MKLKYLYLMLYMLCGTYIAVAQNTNLSSSEIKVKLEKLNVLGSVLYFAAHPDDENTKLIAYLAQDRKYKTGYLSLTRGDGGQNLIGTEQGIELGLIRTQELLAARKIDKGEQFFTSAYDFGFSKTHQETFEFWDKEAILREAVYIIRKLRPDVIITRFPPDARGGHGHHQASAILAHEAYLAAADANKYPEQLSTVKPWKAKRLVWNTANFGGMNNTSEDQLSIDIGNYNPLIGASYGEIAAKSRSQHKSQGFGSASSRGKSIEYFEHVAGEEAKQDLFDGIITTWDRVPKSAGIQQLVTKINEQFNSNYPENSINDLILLLNGLQKIEDSYWITEKSDEIKELILACAGIWIDATTPKTQYVAEEIASVALEAIVRRPNVAVEILSGQHKVSLKTNELWQASQNASWDTPSQPYWLVHPHTLGKFDVNAEDIGYPENKNLPTISFHLKINDREIHIDQSVRFRFVDPVRGELYRPITIMPDLTITPSLTSVLSKNSEPQSIELKFENHHPSKKEYHIEVISPLDWNTDQQKISLDFNGTDVISKMITVQPKDYDQIDAMDYLSFSENGETIQDSKFIRYDHIPDVTWFPPVKIALKKVDLTNPVKRVGYIHGAGDLIPQSLSAIGIDVTLLNPNELISANLKQFDAVILGVRLFNVNSNSPKILSELLDYANNGGTVLVQYNVNNRLQTENLGPYPFTISRNRVTEEDAKVNLDKNDPALNFPNKLTEADFEGWVQERGLYFADNIDKNYRTPLVMNDKNEAPNNGSLLVTKYGQGKFVYTSVSFFRQLPAGVPGAYRLFVNLLSKE